MSFFLVEIYYGQEMQSDWAVALFQQQWRRRQEGFPAHRAPRIEGGILRAEGIALFREYVAHHTSGAMWEWTKTIASL